MPLMNERERALATAISKLTYCNPFLPQRIEYEREVLAEEFVGADPVWNIRANSDAARQNVVNVDRRAEAFAETLRARLADGQEAATAELLLYEDVVLYVLYYRRREEFVQHIAKAEARSAGGKIGFYKKHLRDYEHFLGVAGNRFEPRYGVEHVFACCFQIRRAFHHIFSNIVGASPSVARLRAAVWESIFTRDIPRYVRVLYQHMGDFTTLIVGPSGTGKELVARAIGLSRYIPFDVKTMNFVEDFQGQFYPLNLSALSPTLIESELFGHRRGAFTGALEDRAGWLEVCHAMGSVFLDEVAEIAPAIQVKLLRVLQSRTFQRIGDTQTKYFRGKLLAATNRDLAIELQAGRLREDFYYRLCSDVIRTPPLCETLRESPEEVRNMILFIAHRITAPHESPPAVEIGASSVNREAESLTDEVESWIARNLGRDYAWPGNFRELEQCVRNVLIRGEYRPPARAGRDGRQELAEAVCAGTLTADELLQRYCRLVHAQTGNYQETARRLGLDRRTVKAKVDGREERSQ
jgi:DNA-binding NtrC family response regulator